MACWTAGFVKIHSPTGLLPPAKVGQRTAWPDAQSAGESGSVGGAGLKFLVVVMARARRCKVFLMVATGPLEASSCQEMCLAECISDDVVGGRQFALSWL